MVLIIGLGNPGEKYSNNRHNVGHMVVDALLKRKSPKDLVVKKTDVYMNESGEFVKKLVEQFGVNTSNLWIIHDDLDIALGNYKIQFGVGPKVHGGIGDIEEKLGTKDFWRVRVGVDDRKDEPFDSAQGKEYVLEDFEETELATINSVIKKAIEELLTKV